MRERITKARNALEPRFPTSQIPPELLRRGLLRLAFPQSDQFRTKLGPIISSNTFLVDPDPCEVV
jgi:hypothetical protein